MVELLSFLALATVCAPVKPVTAQNPVVLIDLVDKKDSKSTLPFAEPLLGQYLTRAGVYIWKDSQRRGPSADQELLRSGISAILRAQSSKKGTRTSWKLVWKTINTKKELLTNISRDAKTEELALALTTQILNELGMSTVDINTLVNGIPSQPGFIYEKLNEGYSYLREGLSRKAEFKFERVLSLRKFGMIPGALDGLIEARTLGKRSNRELAQSAAQRAVVQERNRQYQKAYGSWQSFLQYTPHRARPFELAVLIGDQQPQLFPNESSLWIQNSSQLMQVDTESGAIIHEDAAIKNLIAIYADSYLIRSKSRLQRISIKSGKIVWSTQLDKLFRKGMVSHTINSGFIALFTDTQIQWFDLTSGEALQSATDVRIIQAGVAGAIFQRTKKGAQEMGLLRPGRNTPSWTIPLTKTPDTIAQVRGRILVRYGKSLSVLDARNGKQRGKEVDLLSENPRYLGARGRYAAFSNQETLVLVDVLASIKTAQITGPGLPSGVGIQPEGILVSYDTQDVIYYDREGTMKDRTRIEGSVHSIVRGHPKVPSNILITNLGIIALGDVPSAETYRDLDGFLAMARLLVAQKEKGIALELLDHLAVRSLGQIAVTEIERCRLLEIAPQIQSAHQRAYAASDSRQTVPRFRNGN